MKNNLMKPLALAILTCSGGSAFAANIMLDFGATAVASPYLTLSPGHASSAIPAGQTTWNTITSATPPSNLVYSDNTTATGVILALGQESTVGNNIVSFSTSITNVALAGSGGGVNENRKYLTPGSIYGDDGSSTAAGRDGFFGGGTGGAGAAIGLRLDGLAAGQYDVYVMARNTNSNAISVPMSVYASTGTSATTFDFSSLVALSQSNPGYLTGDYTNQFESFVNGDNFVKTTVTVGTGGSLFLAVEGGSASETRGFLNMVQIVAVPEPSALALLGCSGFLLLLRRRA